MSPEVRRHPKVTVLMPVYNGEPYVMEAIDSILGQTFGDFELLVINDCSTDGSAAIIEKIVDERIRVVHNPANLGLAATLNKGIGLARGSYLARMDQDDIATPDRLQRQVAYMDAHPDVAICGCGVEVFYEDGGTHRHYYPLSYDGIKVEALFNSPVSHPGALLRKRILNEHAYRYDETPHAVEDYELFSRILHRHRVVNLPYFLLRYRVSGHNETARAESPERASIRQARITSVQQENLAQAGYNLRGQELELHYLLSLTTRLKTIDFSVYPLNEIKGYLYRLRAHLEERGYARRRAIRRIVGKIFLKVTIYNWNRMGGRAHRSALGSSLLWDGIRDVLALRIDYLLKTKRK